MRSRWSLAVVVIATVLALAVASPVAASAGARGPQGLSIRAGTDVAYCEPANSYWMSWGTISKPNVVTHATRYYNGTSSNESGTFSAAYQTSVTATVTVTAGGSLTAGFVIGKLEVQTSLSLQASGTRTATYTESVTATIPPHTYTVMYAGTLKATGNYTYYHCDSGNGLRLVQSGNALSWTVMEIGAAQCNITQPPGSLAALAKSYYC